MSRWVASLVLSLVEVATAVALVPSDVDLDTTVPPGITLIVANIHRNLDGFLHCRHLDAETLNLLLAFGFQLGIMPQASEQRDGVYEIALVMKRFGAAVTKKFEGLFKSGSHSQGFFLS